MKRFWSSFILVFCLSIALISCGGNGEGDKTEVHDSPAKDQSIQEYNLEQSKDLAKNRNPYDTLALREFIINNYPPGSYLMRTDRSLTYSLTRDVVIYQKTSDALYVFALIAKSRNGERLIDTKNVTGYNSSFINLDSTRLGTAFFYLTLFKCADNTFQFIWDKEIPMHGGLNKMYYRIWRPKNIPYITINFEDAIIVGHRNYNVFLVNGLTGPPHLLETYEGLSRKRTIGYVNKDKYPDYYEFFFYNLPRRIAPADSVPFIWDTTRTLYVNTRNRNQTRPY